MTHPLPTGTATARELPGAWRIHAAVERWALHAPSRPAVTAPDGSFTFAELAAETARLAATLREAGAGRGTGVGLCLGRSRWLVPSLLATWRVGAVAVPTDDRHPDDRVSFVLRDAGVSLVLADRDVAAVAPRRTTVLDPSSADVPPGQAPVPPSAAPGDCAYVIYTSGTSGWPKGVEATYQGLDAFLAGIAQLRLEPGGLGVNAVSPAFDGWLWCTLLYLLHGQGVALVDIAGAGGTGVGEAVRAVAPVTVCLTPSLLAACDDLPTVDTLAVAGEPCPPGLLDRFRDRSRLLNVYGPTEATIAATWADSARGDDLDTIGRPLPGFRAYVLDEAGEPVAPGEPGELHLGGPGLARGYRGRPAQTAAAFVADPFAGGGARMYRTGDVVVARPDGQLAYVGRRDHQVKVRGVRVELAEVEQVATGHAGVRAAAAFLAPGDSVGLAVVARDASADGLAAEVRRRCASHLPEAMVPSTVHVVDALPTSPTGKVDRESLATLARPLADGPPPRTLRERQVCEVYSDLLPAPVTGVDVNFFDSGGHSLLATRAVAALRKVTGLRLSMRDLLANPTPAALAAVLEQLDTAIAMDGAAGEA